MTDDALSSLLASVRGTGTALEWCGHTMSHRRLAQVVDELTAALVRTGAAGSNVLVFGPLCPAYVAGLLACLRAGAVAVPVDAGLTPAQYAWTERTTRPSALLTNDVSPSAHWQSSHDANELVLGSASGQVLLHSPARRDRGDIPRYEDERAGYLIPTSGSTGAPKAVVGSRNGLHEFLSWFTDEFGLGPDDTVAALTRVNFDPSLRELLAVLSVGGTLRLPAPDAQLDLTALASHVASGRTTTLFLVPSLARRLADALRSASLRPTALRRAFFAGETLTAQVIEQWRELAPDAEFVNLYGLTEGTLAQLYRRHVRPQDADLVRGVPVGRPRPGVRVLLDGGGTGGHGEVLVTSAAPAFGMLTTPTDRAGERTLRVTPIPRPLRTGDVGVLDARGELSIAGRISNDLKVSGRRVSYHRFVAETEQLPGVNQCVVVDRGGPHAFVAGARVPVEGDQGQEGWRERVRGVARRLDVPVPTVHLRRELPLLRSGKVDRLSLAASVDEAMSAERREARGGVSVSEVLLELLCLGAGVTASTPFVDAGVSSLEMMEFALKVNQLFGLALTPKDCYEQRDAETLARTVECARGAQAAPADRAAPAVDDNHELIPLSTRQLAYMSLCMADGNANWCNLSREIHLRRPVGRAELRRALAALVARHDVLRLRLAPDRTHQVHSEPSGVTCPVVVHDARSGNGHRAHVQPARVEAVSPLIDVESGPPLRAALVSSDDETSVLLVGHHLYLDGLGMDLLAAELRAHLAGGTVPEPPAADSYRAYCRATRRTRESGREAEYWRSLLKGAGQTHLPQADGPDTDAGMLLSRPFGVVASRAAHRLAARTGVSVFAVVLAAYEHAVTTVYGLSSLPVVVPVQVREQVPPGAVGMFTSQLVVRGGGPAGHLAARAGEFAHQLDAGIRASAWEFDERVEELGLAQGTHFPLSTVLFNQHPHRRGLRARELGSWRPRPLGRSLRYQLQGELQMSAAEMALTYYYRKGISMNGTDAIDRVHAEVLATLRGADEVSRAH